MESSKHDALINAGAGYLLAAFADIAFDSLDPQSLESPVDLSDDKLGVIGKAAGMDERICSGIADSIRRNFNKSWSAITEAEWQSFSSQFPESAEYLREAIPS